MSSTTNSAAHTMDPNIPVSEMVELMPDMRNILLECHKQHHETNAPSKLREAKRGVRGAADDQAANSSMKCSLPKRKFGLKSQHVQRTNPLAANYDYRLKYPENRQYHEHDAEARVWWVYLDEATAFDNDMVSELGDSLDILLVFAGLFSAVVTTFVVQTSQALSVDYATVSASYLGEISAILRANGNISTISQIPTTDMTFSPTTGDIWVNGIWFTSLIIALSVALFAVLAKQWLRQYMSIVTGTPRERTFIRQFRYEGLRAWKVQAIIGIFPVLLHLSPMLFLVGLVIFLVPLDVSIAYVTGAITATVVLFYLAASAFPLCIVKCPYRTTFSELFYYIFQIPRVVYQRVRHPWTPPWYTRVGIFNVLKDVERNAACLNDEDDHQELILKALWWLGETTSNISAKEIILCSLGAFAPSISKNGIHLAQHKVDDHREMFRLMIHFSASDVKDVDLMDRSNKILSSDPIPEPWDIDFALAFCASDAPVNLNFIEAPRLPKPSEGLSWLVDDYLKADPPVEVEVPPLVWMGLFKATLNKEFLNGFRRFLQEDPLWGKGWVIDECHYLLNWMKSMDQIIDGPAAD
ncbi:hypothetical protein FB446DRAFT_791845 [Lentinula raphanica]|nr:hypothetical protein FB446DRAFT_791845 [Lentinula raphanica]